MRIRTGARAAALVTLLVVNACAAAVSAERAAERPAEGTSERQVRWSADTLTIRVHDLALPALLEAVAHATGAEVKGTPRATGKVTLELENARLDDALHRILGEQNFTVRYGAKGAPSVIQLLGGPEAPPSPPAAGTPPTAAVAADGDRPALPPRLGFPKQFPSKRALALPESLQKIAGSTTATFDQAFDLATLQSEGLTRALASQVVLSQVERDRRVRRAVLSAVARLDEGTMAQFRGTVEGTRVRELLEFLSAHSREPGVQRKAGVALDRFLTATGETPP